MERVELKGPGGARATVYRHGAHVTAWATADGVERLFVSEEAVFKPPKAIRGGIPVCFPQFGDLGPLGAQHGFARNSEWAVVPGSQEEGKVAMRLEPIAEQLELWPHKFALTLTFSLTGDSLTIDLALENTGSAPLTFTVALVRVPPSQSTQIPPLQQPVGG